jgi:hypothetical protein
MKITLQTALVIAGGLLVGAVLVGGLDRGDTEAPADAAHQMTVAATASVATAEKVFVHDTVVVHQARIVYQERRDTALVRLTDTIQVKAALAAADNALELDSTAIASAGRAIEAHRVLEGALRTELAISRRLQVPRFQLSSVAGVEVGGMVPVTGIEAEARVTRTWSIVGRVEKRWTAGEPTRRLLLVRRTF